MQHLWKFDAIWTNIADEIDKQACPEEEEGNYRQADRLYTA